MDKVFDKVNIVGGVIATALTAMFGKWWILFAIFFALNIIDYATGLIKAKYFLKNENSKTGAIGAWKKVSYWIVICMAFLIAFLFRYFGDILSIDLSFVILFGWFTLASYMINECRSIIENANQMGADVPKWLTRGLEVAGDTVNDVIDKKVPKKGEEIYED